MREGTVEAVERVLGISRYEMRGRRIPGSTLSGGAYFYTIEVENEQELFRRRRCLLLYLIVSCFLSYNGTSFPAYYVGMVDFPDGARFDWGSFTFASFLQAMRRRVSCPSPMQFGFLALSTMMVFRAYDCGAPFSHWWGVQASPSFAVA